MTNLLQLRETVARLREAGFTPGPWYVRESRDGTGDLGIVAQPGIVAECFRAIRRHDERSPETDANARLIAAAPDLLTGIEHLLKREEALREALEPFAALAGDGVNMHDPLSKWLTVGQLWQARTTLAETQEGNP